MIGINQVSAHLLKWIDAKEKKQHKEKYLFYQGGTYAGKTMGVMLGLYMIAQKRAYEIDAWNALPKSKRKGAEPEPYTIRVVGINVAHLKAGAMKDLIKVLSYFAPHLLDYVNLTDKLFRIGKCEIQFFASDKPEKALGVKSNITYINEANKMRLDIVQQLNARTDLALIADWNPTSVFWAHQEMYLGVAEIKGIKHTKALRKDVRFCQWNYLQNKEFIGADKIAEIEGWRKTDTNFYNVYGLGYLGTLEGVVFPKVAPIKYFPDDCEFEVYGLDWGGVHAKNDPTAVVRIGIREHDPAIYCEEIYYGWDSPQKVARILFERLNAGSVVVADTNNTASTQTLQQELRLMANHHEVQTIKVFGAKKGAGSRIDGVSRLQAFDNIRITEDSSNWLEEAKTYIYKDRNGVSEPQDGNDHLWDAARYAVTSATYNKEILRLKRQESNY